MTQPFRMDLETDGMELPEASGIVLYEAREA
jgi:hypothetical protein